MKRVAFYSLIASLVLIAHPASAERPRYMRVYYIQWAPEGGGIFGDCQYYEFPGADGILDTADDRNLLIDAGDTSNSPVITFLDSKIGVGGTLWFMALSHAHEDHYGGMSAVLTRYVVKNFYECTTKCPLSSKDSTLSTNIKNEVGAGHYFEVTAGDYLSGPNPTKYPADNPNGFDPYVVDHILAAGTSGSVTDPNDASIVHQFSCGSSVFLSGGDAETGITENTIVSAYPTPLAKTDIYKVHHHGSDSSSGANFLSQMSAEYAVVQTAYGGDTPPTASALNRIWNSGAIVYRNDLDGTVLFKCDSQSNFDITRSKIFSGTSSHALAYPPPDPPQNLQVTAVATSSVSLNWDDVVAVSPGVVYGYDVFRSTIGNGDPGAGRDANPGCDATGIYQKINTGIVAVSEYTDTTTQAGITYYYRVSSKATYMEGTDTVCYERRYSNEASGGITSPWPMFHNDAQRTGKSSEGGPLHPALKWSYGADGNISSSPALSFAGTVYVGAGDNRLYSIDSGGTLLWSYAAAEPISSAPAVRADTVWVGSDDNRLYCVVDPAGLLSWSYESGGDISSSPVVSGAGAVYVGSGDNRLYSLDPVGDLLWTYATFEPISSSPAVSTDTVCVGSEDNRLYCVVDLTGLLSWSYESGGDISSSPAVSGTGAVYVGSGDNRLYSLDPAGSLLWSYAANGPILSSPAIGTDTVYVGSDDNRLYCVIDGGGALSWSYETRGDISSSPVVSRTDAVYVGSRDNHLYSLNSVGSLLWRYDASEPISSSLAIGTDTVYVGSDDNFLYALVEATLTPTDTPKITPTPTPTWPISVSTPTPTSTPPVPPTATPIPPLVLVPGALTAGQTFSLYIALTENITQPFDFYILADTPAGVFTIYLNGKIKKKITPIFKNVRKLSAGFSKTVRPAVRIPLSMKGKPITFYTAVIEAGKKPPIKKLSDLRPDSPYVIMMDKKTVIVAP